jgi:hypothetical protein
MEPNSPPASALLRRCVGALVRASASVQRVWIFRTGEGWVYVVEVSFADSSADMSVDVNVFVGLWEMED